MEGIDNHALHHIVSQIVGRGFDFPITKKTVNSLITYDDMFSVGYSPRHPLAKFYIRSSQETSQNNLTTKPLLESFVEGNPLPLMSVKRTGYRDDTRYKHQWSTDHLDHGSLLDTLRYLGNPLFEQGDGQINESHQYNKMLGLALECLSESQTLWSNWGLVVNENVASPLVLANDIFVHLKKGYEQENVEEGIRALLYLDQENYDSEIGDIIRRYSLMFVDRDRMLGMGNPNLITTLHYEGPDHIFQSS